MPNNFYLVELTANENLLGRWQNLPVGLEVYGDDAISQANLSVDTSDGTLLSISDVRIQNVAGYVGNVLFAARQWLTLDVEAVRPVTGVEIADVYLHYETDGGSRRTEVVKVAVSPYSRDVARIDLTAELPDAAVLQAVGIGTVTYGDTNGVAYGYPAE